MLSGRPSTRKTYRSQPNTLRRCVIESLARGCATSLASGVELMELQQTDPPARGLITRSAWRAAASEVLRCPAAAPA